MKLPDDDSPLVDRGVGPLDPEILIAYLQRHRAGVRLVYVVLIVVLAAILAFPKRLLGQYAANGNFDDWWSPLLIGVAFFAFQGAFLFGGWDIRKGSASKTAPRIWIAVLVAGGLMGLLTAGAIMTFLEYGNRADGPAIEQAPYNAGIWLRHMPVVVGVLWTLWAVLLFFHVHKRAQDRALWRLLEFVFVGSWAEFVVAASVHLTLYRTRVEHSTCRCDLGTWLALCFSFPILVWSIGPAVLLLYVREWSLTKAAPNGRWLRLVIDRRK